MRTERKAQAIETKQKLRKVSTYHVNGDTCAAALAGAGRSMPAAPEGGGASISARPPLPLARKAIPPLVRQELNFGICAILGGGGQGQMGVWG